MFEKVLTFFLALEALLKSYILGDVGRIGSLLMIRE